MFFSKVLWIISCVTVVWIYINKGSVREGEREESEKVGLKLNIQKTNIMASSPIISWQTDGKTVETVADFILVGSKITADGN